MPTLDHDADFEAERATFFGALTRANIDYEAFKTQLHRVGVPAPSCGGRAMRQRILSALAAGRPISYIIEVEASFAMGQEEARWGQYRASLSNGATRDQALAKIKVEAPKARVEAPKVKVEVPKVEVPKVEIPQASPQRATLFQIEQCAKLGITPILESRAATGQAIIDRTMRLKPSKLTHDLPSLVHLMEMYAAGYADSFTSIVVPSFLFCRMAA